MSQTCRPLPLRDVTLSAPDFRHGCVRDPVAALFHGQYQANRRYVLSLDSDALLRNFRMQAGHQVGFQNVPHGGWDYLFRWTGDEKYTIYFPVRPPR